MAPSTPTNLDAAVLTVVKQTPRNTGLTSSVQMNGLTTVARGGYGNPALQAKAEAQARANGESTGTPLERNFDAIWKLHQFGLPPAIPEYKFALPRQYRFDRAWAKPIGVAVELEGGIWMQLSGGKSRHTFPPGFIEDLRKYDLACSLGWLVFRFTGGMLNEPGQLEAVADTIRWRMKAAGLTLADLAMETQLTLREERTNG